MGQPCHNTNGSNNNNKKKIKSYYNPYKDGKHNSTSLHMIYLNNKKTVSKKKDLLFPLFLVLHKPGSCLFGSPCMPWPVYPWLSVSLPRILFLVFVLFLKTALCYASISFGGRGHCIFHTYEAYSHIFIFLLLLLLVS